MMKKFNNNEVAQYYENCEIDYRLIWDLDNAHELHYGYWDEGVKRLGQALNRENEIVASIAKVKKKDKVLDAGCGVGGSVLFLSKRIGCQATGITLSKKQAIEGSALIKKYNLQRKSRIYRQDYLNNHFKGGSFSVVWSIESMCHIPNNKEWAAESYRVLKKGGKIVVADGFLSHKINNQVEKGLMDKWLQGWRVNILMQPEEFKRNLENVGFRNIRWHDITDNVMPSSKLLYYHSFPAYFFGKIAEFLGLRNKIQTGNIIAAHYQYKALKKKLWRYLIFYAEKP